MLPALNYLGMARFVEDEEDDTVIAEGEGFIRRTSWGRALLTFTGEDGEEDEAHIALSSQQMCVALAAGGHFYVAHHDDGRMTIRWHEDGNTVAENAQRLDPN